MAELFSSGSEARLSLTKRVKEKCTSNHSFLFPSTVRKKMSKNSSTKCLNQTLCRCIMSDEEKRRWYKKLEKENVVGAVVLSSGFLFLPSLLEPSPVKSQARHLVISGNKPDVRDEMLMSRFRELRKHGDWDGIWISDVYSWDEQVLRRSGVVCLEKRDLVLPARVPGMFTQKQKKDWIKVNTISARKDNVECGLNITKGDDFDPYLLGEVNCFWTDVMRYHSITKSADNARGVVMTSIVYKNGTVSHGYDVL